MPGLFDSFTQALSIVLHPEPEWAWLQLEVTSRPAGDGPGCLHSVMGDNWLRRDFDPAVVAKLASQLRKAKQVHLAGWGEPLHHPDFPGLVRAVSQLTKRTTTASTGTINGIAASEEYFEKLLRAGLSTMTFPISAFTEKEQMRRKGVSLRQIHKATQRLRRVRDRLNADLKIGVLCTLHRGSEQDIEKLPTLVDSLGADMIMANPLPFAPHRDMENEVMVPRSQGEYIEMRDRLQAIRQHVERRGSTFHAFLINGGITPTSCMENPLNACYVGADGGVSPCIFLGMPILNRDTYHFQGQTLPAQRVIMGNLNQKEMAEIWRASRYNAFRKPWYQQRLPSPCQNCWRPYLTII